MKPLYNRVALFVVVGLTVAAGYFLLHYSEAASGLQVSGNELTMDGSAVVPRGFNMIGVLSPPGCTNGAGVAARDHFNQTEMNVAKSWDATLLRLQVSQSGLSTTNAGNLSTYLTQIENSVALARSNGFMVDVSMQDQSIGCGPAHPLPDSQTVTAWHNLASHLASDPDVMLELFNEPQNDESTAGWNQWQNGGSSPLANQGSTAVGYQTLLNDIRADGANNVVLADGGSFAEQLQGIPMLKDTATGRGVMYAVHPYYFTEPGGESSWQSRFGYLTSKVPVLATEWNYLATKCGTSAQTLAPTFLSYLQSHNIGVLAHALDALGTTVANWSYTPTQCGTSSGGSGAATKSYFASLPKQPTPKPSPTNTPTPTPSATPKPTPTPSTTTLPSPTPSSSPSPGGNSVTLIPTSDTYVDKDNPKTNYGNTDPLKTSDINNRALLRFKSDDVVPEGYVLSGVTLRLYVDTNAATSGGLQIHTISPNWVAGSTTWDNQPAWDSSVLATSATPKAGAWVSIPLPFDALAEDDDTTLGVSYSAVNAGVTFNSRENTSTPPQLIIAYTPTVTGDTTPPTPPSNVVATAASATTVNVHWGASTDNVAVAKYVVVRNGITIGSVPVGTTNYSDTTAQPSTKYTYVVRAYDTSNNESSPSNTSTVTTPAQTTKDTTPPTAPTGLNATLITASQINLSWTASTDNVGVVGYYVYQDGNKVATVPAPLTSFGESSLNAATTYEFFVRAYDAAGNVSANSSSLQVKTDSATSDPVVVAAGDISTGTTDGGNKQTSDLVLSLKPTAVITMGDNQYNTGSAADFAKYFAPTWGRFKNLIHPAPGHHEYYTDHTAAGYYSYFGAAANNASQPNCKSSCEGYYSFNLGSWHLIALNTNHYLTSPKAVCAFVACDASSAQVAWLKQDLANNTQACTLAYWSDPRWTSGTTHGSNPVIGPIWDALYAGHADLALNGHEHLYERFAKQNPQGQADPAGIREIIAGTGGNDLYPFGTPIANSQMRNDTSKGVLQLTLHSDSYTWQFVPATGTFTDFGTQACNK
ncbi:MAG TPA: cellulase family glycosylhydrolase [Candidatus Saccharimonadia bacterium]|nr:cellulase family glycosylhydrolase [Candidatus Saccharimonadia bacterium]